MGQDKHTDNSSVNSKVILIAMPWVIFLLFMQVFNENVFSLVTPKIAEDFAITPGTVSWVVTIGGLILGVGGAIYAALSDSISFRKLFVFGVVTFVAGSLLGFIVQSSFVLVVLARAIQCMGAAVIPGCFIVLVRRYAPKEQQPLYLGYGTAMYQLSAGIGHIIGGYVAKYFSWTFSFLLPLVVLITLPVFLKYLPDETGKKGKLDIIGAIILTVLSTVLILAVTRKDMVIGLIGLVILVFFVLYSKKRTDPILDLSVFRIKTYTPLLLVSILIYCVQSAFFFIFPFFIRDVYSAGIEVIGLMFVPANFGAFISGMLAGKITNKIGKLKAFYVGTSIVLAGMLMFGIFLGMNIIYMWIALALFGIGYTIVYSGFYTSFTGLLPDDRVGISMSVYNLITKIILSLFVALVGILISQDTLDVKLLPLPEGLKHVHLYSNVCLLFSLMLAGGMVLFEVCYGRKERQRLASETIAEQEAV
ncbi:MFS transporter [Paenibacillus elgii]|uniref:MFS transporter n=1 Tax=Paenibacillus elgii TaxID=189691 RepID=UPI000FDA6050|nr:MFS transporter [Paenibacillus elgii]NEN86937.1 MFS transporter [Paenibacillus elgii]